MSPQEWQRHLMTQGRKPEKNRGANVVDINAQRKIEPNWPQIIGAAVVIAAGFFFWRQM